MCGIFGYIGPKDKTNTTIEGLKKLEYRGYDSAGIAGVADGDLVYYKEVGKISALEKALEESVELDVAIGHTRWATHGKPSRENAHPQFNSNCTLAVVHNGIIENYSSIRDVMKKSGIIFRSETDTEVIAHLISDLYRGDILSAVQQALLVLKGSYAIAVVHKDFPDRIIVAANESPLAIGIGQGESFISSDPNAFSGKSQKVLFLEDGEVGVVKKDDHEIYDSAMTKITKEVKELAHLAEEISRGEFEHFTLKEIFEQPQSLRAAISSRFDEEHGTAIFDTLHVDSKELSEVERVIILACGTSWHAGYIGAYMLEETARIPTQIEISSEYRYRNPIVQPNTLVIAISQSGETADTLAAMRELKAKGATVVSICNVHESTLVRESNSTLFLRAGPEIGVCSTKAFTSQVAVLALFTLLLGRMRNIGKDEGIAFIEQLKELPEKIKIILSQSSSIQAIAKKFSRYRDFFYIGRRYMFPTALEGALKLKEISYINASAYPAGEIKHGPIALINEECPTVAFCGDKVTFEKTLSNLMEVKARNGKVIAIAEEGADRILSIADEVIWVPKASDELSTILSSVAGQLFAYYTALELGTDIDQPKNLAKSVTVE